MASPESAMPTRGCATAPPPQLSTRVANGTRYKLSYPNDYDASRPIPLLLSFHGWGGSIHSADDLHAHGRLHGYAVASPEGGADANGTFTAANGYASWNGAGTSAAGTCVDPERKFSYCYRSCAPCADTCSWTTCDDSVAAALAVLADAEAALCIDPRRVHATGVSNGGVFLYELAADPRSAARFASYAPVVGAPHAGFNRPPLYRAPFFGVWGRIDHTIPPLQNPDAAGHPGDPTAALDAQWSGPGSGWLWSTARNATALWARANGCVPEVVEAPPWVDLDAAAKCVAWSGCDEAEVIECLTPGGHEIPPWRARVQWAFMQRHELPARPQPTAPLPDGWPASAGVAATEATVPLVVVVPVAAVAAVVGCFFSVAAGWAYRRWRKGVPAGQRRRLGSM